MSFRSRTLSVVTLALLLAVPASTLVAPGLGGVLPSSLGFLVASAVPGVLELPFASRAGYDAGAAAKIVALAPDTESNVLVALTFLPSAPQFFAPPTAGGRPWSSAEIAASFAPPGADRSGLQQYLGSYGLRVVHDWPDGMGLTVEGTASQVGAAFHTHLATGVSDGRSVRLPTQAPSLPEPFESEVAAISGLSDGFTPFVIPFSSVPLAAPAAVRTTSVITPSAVHQVYGLDGLYNYSGSPHWATGVGISLVLWGEGYAPSDLQGFFANYYPAGFPAEQVNYLPVDGAPAPSESAVNDPSNVTSEMTLDLEWAGSAAPGATLTAVYAPDGPASNHYSPADAALEDAINAAIQSTGASVVSMSFGTPDGSDPSFQAAVSVSLADAERRQITVVAASGDTGGTLQPGCQGGPSPEFPASSPFVVATGGTAPVLGLDAFGGVTGIQSEPAWNRSGGGFSTVYPAPSWQTGSRSGGRGVPDVAGPASDNVFYYKGQEAAGAGTSFAAPFWSGMLAEMDGIRGSSLGYIDPRLEDVGGASINRGSSAGLVDITSGGNCLGPATTGWDDVTGWGTPRGLALYEELSGTFVNVTLTIANANVAPGSSVSVSVLVTNATSGAAIGQLNISYVLASVSYVGPCGGTMATASGTTSATGTSSTALTVPSCYFGTQVSVTATVNGHGYFGSASQNVGVNLVGLAGFLAVIQSFPYNLVAFAAIVGAAVLLGWRLGNWRDRPRAGAAAGPGRPSGPPASSPPVAARSAATSGPGAPPPRTSPRATPSEGPPPEPPTVPSHVLSPPAAPPPLLSFDAAEGAAAPGGAAWGAAPTERPCPQCGAGVPALSDRCPGCAASVP